MATVCSFVVYFSHESRDIVGKPFLGKINVSSSHCIINFYYFYCGPKYCNCPCIILHFWQWLDYWAHEIVQGSFIRQDYQYVAKIELGFMYTLLAT